VAYNEVMDVGFEAITELTVTDPAEFDKGLELVRARGWASDVGETWDGVASIAAPILDRRRMPVGAVGITGAVERMQAGHELRPRLIAAVRDCARAVSRDLGAGRF
jgi:DNA-binding IclR family transcriptional regulator